MASPTAQEKAIAAQIQKLNFLVADPSTARNGIRGLLSQLNVKPAQIQVVETLGDTITMIQKHKPNVLFLDTALMADQAVSILEAQKSSITHGAPRILCLLTSGDANTGNGDAIEDEVEASIAKPFSMEELKTSVTLMLEEKLNPSPYRKLLDEAKALYKQGKNQESLPLFQKAKVLNIKSPVAGHYQAMSSLRLGQLPMARMAFLDNLERHPKYYPSLCGLFEVYLKEENHTEAYQVGRKMVIGHPIPIKRLPDLIRLSVLNASFEDILGFYRVADAIQASADETAMHLASALVVAGLHFMKVDKKDAALDSFRKAEVMGKGNSRILKRILVSLMRKGMNAEVKAFMMRAPEDVKNSTELKVAELEYLLDQPDKKDALDFAIALAQKNVPDPKIFHAAISLSIEFKRKSTATRGLISIAVRAFPDLEAEFRAYEPNLPQD